MLEWLDFVFRAYGKARRAIEGFLQSLMAWGLLACITVTWITLATAVGGHFQPGVTVLLVALPSLGSMGFLGATFYRSWQLGPTRHQLVRQNQLVSFIAWVWVLMGTNQFLNAGVEPQLAGCLYALAFGPAWLYIVAILYLNWKRFWRWWRR